jgi:hypothetical protein
VDQIPYGEAHLYHGELIRCQSDHIDYACSCRRVGMSGGDRMDSSTLVPVVRCVWVPMVMSYHARH